MITLPVSEVIAMIAALLVIGVLIGILLASLRR